MNGRIELNGMQFHAFHGCLPEEKTNGNDFIVDLSFTCDITGAATSDRLEDTVDYSAVYGIVAAEMGIASNLLENVAWRIKKAVESKFRGIGEVRVRVAKKNPPVSGLTAESAVIIED